ncbi:GNAT family N-acetyltransferase [Rheinheimera sp. SA_1]|uniref:GNAT family N-acetyltransferase n=1 Tax=Rheinheimera sp. SA_1 TaxID=1827365 RepID=UPI000AF268B9|nr:GNAT family N-acetyltransferase [Rheinheimera sp. SA_1]
MLTQFSPTIEAYWHNLFLRGDVIYRGEQLTVVISSTLPPDRRLMLRQSVGGQLWAVMAPDIASQLGLSSGLRSGLQPGFTEALLRQRLQDAGIRLYGADKLFYFSAASQQALLQQAPVAHVRQLHAADAPLFTRFQSRASAQDLDDAYVELDHWAVFGAFVDGQLVCAASMYPWDGEQIADTGVLTLPDYRGVGHARNVIRAISHYACEQGYQPQYRCQTDNLASTALARAAGLDLFGHWQVIDMAGTISADNG